MAGVITCGLAISPSPYKRMTNAIRNRLGRSAYQR